MNEPAVTPYTHLSSSRQCHICLTHSCKKNDSVELFEKSPDKFDAITTRLFPNTVTQKLKKKEKEKVEKTLAEVNGPSISKPFEVGDNTFYGPMPRNGTSTLEIQDVIKVDLDTTDIFFFEKLGNLSTLQTKIDHFQPDPVPKIIRSCSLCHMVVYCCEQHERLDFEHHKDFCSVMARIMAAANLTHPLLLNGLITNREELNRNILQLKFLYRVTVRRSLLPREEEILSYPSYCEICFKVQQLFPCPRCKGVSYCSVEHQIEDAKRHRQNCGFMELYYSPYKTAPLSTAIRAEPHLRISKLQVTDLIDGFQRVTRIRIPPVPVESFEAYQHFAIASSFSGIGSICLALSYLDLPYNKNKNYVIFIVGATYEAEMYFLEMHMKFFFLEYDKITNVDLHFIGPEVHLIPTTYHNYIYLNRKRTVTYYTYSGLLQEFVRQFNIKPSLIVGFNCDFSEFGKCYELMDADFFNRPPTFHPGSHEEYVAGASGDNGGQNAKIIVEKTWPKGIQEMLINYGVPIVFTSPTENEAKFDYLAFLSHTKINKTTVRIQRLFGTIRNPYRELRPLRSFGPHQSELIYFLNGFLQVLITSMSA